MVAFDGKNPLENDRFARWAIRSEKRTVYDLSIKEVETKSCVFEGMDDNMLETSDAMTGARSCTEGW